MITGRETLERVESAMSLVVSERLTDVTERSTRYVAVLSRDGCRVILERAVGAPGRELAADYWSLEPEDAAALGRMLAAAAAATRPAPSPGRQSDPRPPQGRDPLAGARFDDPGGR